MPGVLPTFDQMDQYVRNKGQVTTRMLIKRFDQVDGYVSGERLNNVDVIIAVQTTQAFANHLHDYIRRENVRITVSEATVRRKDRRYYSAQPGEKFVPLVISVVSEPDPTPEGADPTMHDLLRMLFNSPTYRELPRYGQVTLEINVRGLPISMWDQYLRECVMAGASTANDRRQLQALYNAHPIES